ncbi:putative isopropanol dehydrogenase [Aspergillus stella-maris]|uniref:putative isopropanol dehydrogenase n=1 Tax=Aspergillus stella-maris TaxID=1810926 RepID=UPI003CCCED15
MQSTPPLPLPTTHRALILETASSGLTPKTLNTPSSPPPGTALVRALASPILPYHGSIYSGQREPPITTPLASGFSFIGRIADIASDAMKLKVGELVYVDCVVRARDDPTISFLASIYDGGSEGGRELMKMWCKEGGSFAEFVSVPMENCFGVDEGRLLGSTLGSGSGLGLGYAVQDLAYMAFLLVPFGGLQDINITPGETIVVCPATGFYGSLGVQIAVCMGCRVIAMGRDETKLNKLKDDIIRIGPSASRSGSVETVIITGDIDADASALREFGTIDAVLDITPTSATGSTHTQSAIKSLRRGGRVSLMGSTAGIAVPEVMVNDIMLRGKYMYNRETVVHLIKMLERGVIPLDQGVMDTKTFTLDQWEEAMSVAAEHNGVGKCVVFTP